MSECTHDCSTCSQNCSSREGSAPESMIEKLREGSKIGKVIAVVSGKGGVGKSLVTSLLANNAAKSGKRVCILDADITGPSIPKIFGIGTGSVASDGEAMIPPTSKGGIKIMSLNLLLPNESDPVAWRGPIIAGCVKQFWTDVNWGENDVMFIDMPPGTGDVPLTVFQSLPVDGMVIVTSPQDLVSMIVGKAVRMAELMNIPILGLVENFSSFVCPDCGKEHKIYGESKVDAVASEHGIGAVAKLPIDPRLAALCDAGDLESYDGNLLGNFI